MATNTKNNSTKSAQLTAELTAPQDQVQNVEAPCDHDCHHDVTTVDALVARVASLETQILTLVDEVDTLRKLTMAKQTTVTPAGQDHNLRSQVCEALRLLGARDWVLTQAGLK